MSMLEIAMMGKVPASVLKEAIFAHPTLAEAFNNLFNDDVGWIEWRLTTPVSVTAPLEVG